MVTKQEHPSLNIHKVRSSEINHIPEPAVWGHVMQEQDKKNHYLKHGITLDPDRFQNDPPREGTQAGKAAYQAARLRLADTYLDPVGRQVSEKDFPPSMASAKSAAILGQFSPDARQRISHRALYYETTPHTAYWKEVEQDLLPTLAEAKGGLFAPAPQSTSGATRTLRNSANFLARRIRTDCDLRGDCEAVSEFGSLLLAPDVRMETPLREDLASHYFAHARIQQRAGRDFDLIAGMLPPEADTTCEAIRKQHHQPLAMQEANHCRGLFGDQQTKAIFNIQNDVILTARLRVDPRIVKSARLENVDLLDTQNRINATSLLVQRAQKAGAYSPEMNRATGQLFLLSAQTGCSGASLVGAEATRRSVLMIREDRRTDRSRDTSQEM